MIENFQKAIATIQSKGNNFTHEQFVQAVGEIAISKLSSADQCTCKAIKLAYGAGPDGTRGVTYFKRWHGSDGQDEAMPFVAINALHQTSLVQLAGTTIHELGHVLAGWEAGHGPDWKAACEKLGLRRIRAAGTDYKWIMFDKDIREFIHTLPTPSDGKPRDLFGEAKAYIGNRKVAIKPCSAAIGVRGGHSRGAGSGSRLRLFECACVPPLKVRVARDTFNCTCNDCNTIFLKR